MSMTLFDLNNGDFFCCVSDYYHQHFRLTWWWDLNATKWSLHLPTYLFNYQLLLSYASNSEYQGPGVTHSTVPSKVHGVYFKLYGVPLSLQVVGYDDLDGRGRSQRSVIAMFGNN